MTISISSVLSHRDYKVGWVCALSTELAAAISMLDEEHPSLLRQNHDLNTYTLGRIGSHNVAIACLPIGRMGSVSAAGVAAQMSRSFPALQHRFIVGVGGGVPNEAHDIRLGDVVVGIPGRDHNGVVQYDFGKTIQSGHFVRSGMLNQPPVHLLTAVATLRARVELSPLIIQDNLDRSWSRYPQQRRAGVHPGIEHDKLFKSTYLHPAGETTCCRCDREQQETRHSRPDTHPVIHYGLIASGNQVVRDAHTRDKLRDELGILCFEMEAAALANDFDCLVVRGICDYADSHKNKDLQDYAASTAAAYTKCLLQIMPGDDQNYGFGIRPMSLQNLDLSSTAELEDSFGHFWEHLTVGGLELYEEIWRGLPKDGNALVRYSDFQDHFKSSQIISPRNIHMHWNQLLDAYRAHHKVHIRDALFPQNLCLALLYMLHVNLHYPIEQSHSRRNRENDMSWLRWQLICRFAAWVPCTCKRFVSVDCQRQWNFVRKTRLSRGPVSVPCIAQQWIQDSHNKSTTNSTGAKIDRQNGIDFFALHNQQLPHTGVVI